MAPSLLKGVQKKLRYANSDMIFEIPIKNGVYGENLSALTHKGAVVAILQPLEKKTRETPKYPYSNPQVGTHTHQKFQTSTITNKKICSNSTLPSDTSWLSFLNLLVLSF